MRFVQNFLTFVGGCVTLSICVSGVAGKATVEIPTGAILNGAGLALLYAVACQLASMLAPQESKTELQNDQARTEGAVSKL